MRVLVVEDEVYLAEAIRAGLGLEAIGNALGERQVIVMAIAFLLGKTRLQDLLVEKFGDHLGEERSPNALPALGCESLGENWKGGKSSHRTILLNKIKRD